jgi:hypothetical protein
MKWQDARENLTKIAAVHRRALDEKNKKAEAEALNLAGEVIDAVGLRGVNVTIFLAGFWPARTPGWAKP